MDLGRVGVWLGPLTALPAAAEAEAARELESLGYGTLWLGETPLGREAFAHAALLLAATGRAAVATGILNVWLHAPSATRNGAATLGEAYPGRFALGIGISHPHIVGRLGHEYRKPVSAMREYLDGMDAIDYLGPQPAERVPVVLAALAPRMLELARERTDGAHPYLVTPEHTRRAREVLGAGKLLAPEQAFVLETDPARARELGRAHLERYIAAENYVRSWLLLGFEEADTESGGSDRLVDALVAWGDEDAVRARVEEHLAAGADHVCVQAVGEDPLGDLRRLAPAVL
jgi:probable F420-dependent oxidoreductase